MLQEARPLALDLPRGKRPKIHRPRLHRLSLWSSFGPCWTPGCPSATRTDLACVALPSVRLVPKTLQEEPMHPMLSLHNDFQRSPADLALLDLVLAASGSCADVPSSMLTSSV